MKDCYKLENWGAINLNDIKDKDELNAVLTQIQSYGQTHYLFTVKHPERKLLKQNHSLLHEIDVYIQYVFVNISLIFVYFRSVKLNISI